MADTETDTDTETVVDEAAPKRARRNEPAPPRNEASVEETPVPAASRPELPDLMPATKEAAKALTDVAKKLSARKDALDGPRLTLVNQLVARLGRLAE